MKKLSIATIVMTASAMFASTNTSAEITKEYIENSFHDTIVLKTCYKDKLLPDVQNGLVQFYAQSTLEEFVGYGYSINDIMNTLKSHEIQWINYYKENIEEYKNLCASLNESLAGMKL